MDVVVLNCCVTETNETQVFVEQFDQLGKVSKGTGKPVDFVDDGQIAWAMITLCGPPSGRLSALCQPVSRNHASASSSP